MDPITAELIKLGLQALFTHMETAGKTPEEIQQFFNAEYAAFKNNDPSTLPDL